MRAETVAQFDRTLTLLNDEVTTFVHYREPLPLDKQSVIRMNRDRIYSAAIVDISKGATLTIPETNRFYQPPKGIIDGESIFPDEKPIL